MGSDKAELSKGRNAKSVHTSPPSLFGTSRSSTAGERFDWGKESPETILALIDLVTSRGGAVRFGYSRDGYVGSIGIYYGESRDTLWINPGDGSDLVIERISRTMAELPDSKGVAPAQ